VPGEHTAECEGEKGINRQPQAVTPPAGGYGQETKVHRKRRELEPAKAADRQAQTGIVPIRPWFSAPRASARCEGHGVKYRPKATKKWTSGTGKPLVALPTREQATNRKPQGKRMAQEAKAPSNAGDTLT
jgi:hypothetical protein